MRASDRPAYGPDYDLLPPIRPFCFDYQQLLALGMTQHQIRKLLREGQLTRVARGWYAEAEAPHAVVAALGRGHRLTCFTALSYWGVWTPRQEHAHEYTLSAAAPKRPSIHLKDHARPRTWPARHPIAPFAQAMRDAIRCGTEESAAVVLESAVSQQLLSADCAAALVNELPRDRRRRIGTISSASQSGTETRVHRFLRSLRVPYQQQARLLPDVAVDLLVGDCLVIECDSAAFHSTALVGRARTQYEADRARDHRLHALGFQIVRFSYEQVFHQWEETQDIIRLLVSRRRYQTRGR